MVAERSLPGWVVALVLILGSLAGLALGIWLFGTVWPVDSDPDTALVYGGTAGLFSGLLGASAAAGSAVMSIGRPVIWLTPVVGILFALGVAALTFAGLESGTAPWGLIGASALAICVAWFYLIGMISGVLPTLQFRQFGSWSALAVAIIIIVASLALGSGEGVLFGILSVAAWGGIAIGSVLIRRSASSLQRVE